MAASRSPGRVPAKRRVNSDFFVASVAARRPSQALCASAERPPAVRHISLLLNEADVAVNNRVTEELVDRWRGHGQTVTVRALAFSNHLPHDLINPHEIFGDIDLVYSLLAGMIREAGP